MRQMESDVGVRRGALVLAIAGVVVLGGCGKKPGGQVVAVVNGEEITQQELRTEADGAQIPANQDVRQYGPAIVARLVDRNLLAGYARDQGLDRGPEYIARRRQLEQSLLATLAIRKIVGTPAKPSEAEIARYIAAQPTIFAGRETLALDQVRFPTPSDPRRVQALTKLGSIDAITAQLKADGITAARDKPTLDTASVAPSVARQIVVLKNGELFDFSINGTSFISTIVGRTAAAAPRSTWQAAASEAVRREKSDQLLKDAMAKLRTTAKVDYDPAFKPADKASPPPTK